MEMTEEEIIKKYKDNPLIKTINILADLNGCQAYEIKRILGKAGLYQEKPKRPKKTEPEKILEKIDEIETSKMQKNAKSEGSLKTKNSNVVQKGDSLLEKKPILEPEKKKVPDVVKTVLVEELQRISERMLEICDEADFLNERREQIKEFMKED